MDNAGRLREDTVGNGLERSRYDPLERLTCAYFSDVESGPAPCALRYDHAPNPSRSQHASRSMPTRYMRGRSPGADPRKARP
ncbi:hypothetical protein WME90_43745 [Sorangium sp. So ce375]|uniref:hypothetical protein n=1 Tax=Sorangium sp. So ce375 TaxID=3133306 RepID=UPI003F5BBC8F